LARQSLTAKTKNKFLVRFRTYPDLVLYTVFVSLSQLGAVALGGAFLIATFGCAPKPSLATCHKSLQAGMSEAKVFSLCGKPTMGKARPDGVSIHNYMPGMLTGKTEALHVFFENDKLIHYNYIDNAGISHNLRGEVKDINNVRP